MKKTTTLLFLITLLVNFYGVFSQTFSKSIDQGSTGPEVGSNFIVCEMENTDSNLGLWKVLTPEDANYFDLVGKISPINNTHVEFTGNTPAGTGNDRSPLDYTFICPKTAQYELYLRMHQRLEGQPTDRCNDVYIRMAGNFTSGHALISTEGLKEDQKFFGKGTNWGVGYRIDMIVDGIERRFPARYNLIEGEEYTLTISGRSQRTNLDYWILIDNSEDFAPVAQNDMAELYDSKYRPEETSLSIEKINVNSEDQNILVYPNPVTNTMNVKISKTGYRSYSIYNVNSGLLQSNTINSTINDLSIDMSEFSKGIYFLKIEGIASPKIFKIIKD